MSAASGPLSIVSSLATSASNWLSQALLPSSSVTNDDNEREFVEIDRETEMVYLTFSWWLMNVGWKEIGERVSMAVEEVLGP